MSAPLHVVCLADDAATVALLRDALARALPDARLSAATVDSAGELDAPSAVVVAGREHAAHLLRAGEIAMTLRHALNNPLAALLAEAQMLELESLPGESGASVERMVALCRRLIAIVRELDVNQPR